MSNFYKISLGLVVLVGYVWFLQNWVDPRPVADLSHTFNLGPQTIPTTQWVETPPLTPPFTVQVETQWTAGERDVLYGFMVGSPSQPLSITISPLGYMEITQAEEIIVPFSTFPHLKPEKNQLWLDVQPQNWCLRLNQELAACGAWSEPLSQVGFTGRSFGSSATVEATIFIFHEPFLR